MSLHTQDRRRHPGFVSTVRTVSISWYRFRTREDVDWKETKTRITVSVSKESTCLKINSIIVDDPGPLETNPQPQPVRIATTIPPSREHSSRRLQLTTPWPEKTPNRHPKPSPFQPNLHPKKNPESDRSRIRPPLSVPGRRGPQKRIGGGGALRSGFGVGSGGPGTPARLVLDPHLHECAHALGKVGAVWGGGRRRRAAECFRR